MNDIFRHLAAHGYSVLFGSVFARQLCLPVPAILFLLAAGALAGTGKMNLPAVIVLGMTASVLADLIWYEAGRLRGADVVHLIHRFSSSSDSSAARIRKLFTRYGTKTLLICKFVIGLDAVAPPLAGMTGTDRLRFILFDAAGSALWAGLYSGLGYMFCQQLDKGIALVERMGTFLTVIVVMLVAAVVGRRLMHWYVFFRELRLARITPQQLKSKLDGGERPVIVDVQGCVFHHRMHGASIPGAVRISGRRLGQYRDVPIPADWESREVVLYCSCPNELTSARTAQMLQAKGVERVRPLAGGLQAWIACGFSVSTQTGIHSATIAASRSSTPELTK